MKTERANAATPLKMAIQISLQSETENTIIMRDSDTIGIHIRHQQAPEEKTPTRDALLRVMGPDILTCRDEREIVRLFENGTSQGASNGSLRNRIGTSA